jgi:hypothetical protein
MEGRWVPDALLKCRHEGRDGVSVDLAVKERDRLLSHVYDEAVQQRYSAKDSNLVDLCSCRTCNDESYVE